MVATHADLNTDTLFWMHGLSKNLTVGEAWAHVKTDLAEAARKDIGFHWVQCELNLLGDPTLDMRAREPFVPKVKAPAAIMSGRKQKVAIDAGRPGLTVCLWKGGEVYRVETTGEDGKAALEVAAKTPGKLLLTVSGPSANAFLGEIKVK